MTTLPVFQVELYSEKPEERKKALFALSEHVGRVELSLHDGSVKKFFTIYELCKFAKGAGKKYFPLHLNNYGTVRLLSNHFRAMVRKVINWWCALRKKIRLHEKSIYKPPKYRRRAKHRFAANF